MNVSFYLYFKERDRAEDARTRLTHEGFSVDLRESADEVNWLVLADGEIPEDGLEAAEQRMEELARDVGGEYDGLERRVP